jgi:hypothetical protein
MRILLDFSWIFIFIGIAVLVLYVKSRYVTKEQSFWLGLKSIYTWVISIGVSAILYYAFILLAMFHTLEAEFENHYLDLNGKYNPQVVVKKPSVFLAVEKPVYIGESTDASSIRIGDTINPVASFKKGKGISGDNYLLIRKNGTQYWVLKKSLFTLFKYTYESQPLNFTTSNKEAADQIWRNAKKYIDLYKTYIGNGITDELMNDTILYVEHDKATTGYWLKIKKIERNAAYEFSVSMPKTPKGWQSCVVNGVEDVLGNKPRNDNACAYYMRHGNFYKDPEILNAKVDIHK